MTGKSDDGSENKVSKLVQDRELAILTYLPKWEGFVSVAATEHMTPTDALSKLEQVFKCTVWPMMKIGYGCKAWNPDGFDGNQVCVIIN